MRKMLGVLLVVLLATPTLHAQDAKFNWAPTMIYATGRAADQWSTHRFLNNGSGCVEGTSLLGTRPSSAKLTAFNGLGVAAVAGMSFALHRMGQRTGHSKFARRLNLVAGLVGGALGAKTAIDNVRSCPGR